ncbi:hypothetical protein CPT_Silence55 [Bacillus phage Silence]|nr:hypothetical protein CPT_Silence55 [Bacillus phage Silence]
MNITNEQLIFMIQQAYKEGYEARKKEEVTVIYTQPVDNLKIVRGQVQ